MLTKIDNFLLKFFEKMAKDFNWLTGKDNFFLAFVAILVSSYFWCLCFWEAGGFNDFRSSVASVFTVTLYGMMCSRMVFVERSEVIWEQIRGAKDLLSHGVLKFIRLFFLFVFVPFSALISALTGQYRFWKWSMLSVTALFYLISIDRPSFKRSQAWQKLKEFFAGLSPKPRPVLAPVPKN